ncbi:MAG: Crp/Fnr family transcriptional regulator [Proteobacteria bacterium]|nr:Crp/Fnr family transcriptional regulator [Pseudomonadota bacterium]
MSAPPTTLLEALPDNVRQSLKAKQFALKYPPGAQILRQDDSSKDVFFINYGKVLVTFYTERGNKLSFTEMHAGQSFGELSAIDLERRSANVLAIEETLLTRIEHHKFEALLRSHPTFAHFVMCQMSAMIRRQHNQMYELSALDGTHRIYAELLRMAKNGAPDNGRVIIDNPPTHVEIACRINSHREAVSRTYRALIKDGLLEKHSRRLIITQPDVLQQRIDKRRNGK